MLLVIPFLACISWIIVSPTSADVGCVISTKYKTGDLKDPQPLLLTWNGKNGTILYPSDNSGTLRVPTGGIVYLACPGNYNYLKQKSWGNEAVAACRSDKLFNVNGGIYEFSSLVCNSYPEHLARYMAASHCLGRNSSIEIGFNVSNTFIRMIELCRDDDTYMTYYTKFRMTKMIGSFQRSFPRPFFRPGNFYPGVNMDDLYKFGNQLNTIARILDSTELAKERLNQSVQFLSRGHMAAKTDFVYGALQRLTFWYLNTAPQWQTFNGGNWNTLEMDVRSFATSRRLDLDVYTGVHGQMTMEDVRGKQQPVHLHVDRAIVSVPKFYWKVIYDPLSKRGTAFVGLNDPFIKSITKDIYICEDISYKIEWLKWRRHHITDGISYACTVDDLRKAVPTVPAFDVIGILM